MSPNPRAIQDGLLIIFEGIDGAGKTTQVELSREALESEGRPVQTSRNLGGTPIGEALRQVILSPLERPSPTNLYISVAIQEALIDAIDSARGRSKIILMDRGPLSLAAYEIYGGGLDAPLGWPHVDDGMDRLRPELVIFYKADVVTALQQASQKRHRADYFESQPPSYFERVAKGYEAAAKRYTKQVVTVDGGQSIEAVQAETMRLIRQALTKKTQGS
jgi:dTMP kinase